MSKLSSAETTPQPRINENGDSECVPRYGNRPAFASAWECLAAKRDEWEMGINISS